MANVKLTVDSANLAGDIYRKVAKATAEYIQNYPTKWHLLAKIEIRNVVTVIYN